VTVLLDQQYLAAFVDRNDSYGSRVRHILANNLLALVVDDITLYVPDATLKNGF
jgi:hypothetical protein